MASPSPTPQRRAKAGYHEIGFPMIKYEIQGDNLEIVRVHLESGDEVIAEAGKMIYKTPSVDWKTTMHGKGIAGKLLGGLKRKLTGESLFLTHFSCQSGSGEVGFAGDFPGRARPLHLDAGEAVLVQKDGFVAAEATVQLDIALTKRLGAGLVGGEGFILQRLVGPGVAFIHAGGDFVEFDLAPEESLQVDTGCLVCFADTVDYDISLAGGIATSVFGGEGLFLATLTGPGKVVLQTLTLSKLRRELAIGIISS